MSRVRIIVGDCRSALAKMPDESVQCVVTSPPYWGLRDYGTATWENGDAGCDHRHPAEQRQLPHGDGRANDSYADERVAKKGVGAMYRKLCAKCGAQRVDQQIGLEDAPDAYVSELVAVFREVRRVLRADGTLWLNLGDSYTSGGRTWRSEDKKPPGARGMDSRAATPDGLKPKDLVGIPWRVAFALQADGWYLRSDIIWHKPNPMPESVRDRPTSAHEHIFLLAKSQRYFYDADAIRESDEGKPSGNGFVREHRLSYAGRGDAEQWTPSGGRNKRNVWTVTTQPFPDAHFAVYPPQLIEPCVLAGSAEGDTVLDPFAGSGTTGLVALRHNREFIGCELNPEYAQMARERIVDDAPLLNTEAA